jgi:hypothetical protein
MCAWKAFPSSSMELQKPSGFVTLLLGVLSVMVPEKNGYLVRAADFR